MTPPGTTSQRMAVWLESAWLARYLDRQLSGEEVAWFEAYVLDKPDLLEAVEADTALRDTLALGRNAEARARSDGMASSDTNHEPKIEKTPPARLRNFAKLAIPVSLAAGLALGFLGQSFLHPGDNADELIGSPTHLVFNVMRGPSGPPQIERPESASAYVLVDVSVPSAAQHVALRMEGYDSIPLASSADGFASFLLRRSTMRSPTVAAISYELDGARETREITLPAMAVWNR